MSDEQMQAEQPGQAGERQHPVATGEQRHEMDYERERARMPGVAETLADRDRQRTGRGIPQNTEGPGWRDPTQEEPVGSAAAEGESVTRPEDEDSSEEGSGEQGQ